METVETYLFSFKIMQYSFRDLSEKDYCRSDTENIDEQNHAGLEISTTSH